MATEGQAAFISYSRKDSKFALGLAKRLKAKGANVWMDQLEIKASDTWEDEVEEALTACPRLLVILSPNSVRSENVRDEIHFALDEHKTIIPVLYRDCAIPYRLSALIGLISGLTISRPIMPAS